MSEEHTLYEIEIKTAVSPEELDKFTDIADEAGYVVVTDLQKGMLQLRGEAPDYKEETQ